jgi:hypothetical protein
VVVKLKSGSELPLFMGFFEGAHHQSAMEARRQRLADYIQST